MAEHKSAAEHKTQTTAKGFQQINELLNHMNQVIHGQHEAQTSPKGKAREQALQLLVEQVRKALGAMGIGETLGGEAPSVLQRLEVRSGAAELIKISELLRLRRSETLLDMHEQLREGLGVGSVKHLIDTLSAIPKDEALAAFGVSWRTIERRGKTPRKPLSPEQSGRVFKFAEALAKATDVFGSQEAAETWLSEPAMGLNRQRPIELLATPAGTELVMGFLTRLDYGVYT
jgi:putative toxin-antitoxin system antitoxin component (TIGR02293 family)